LPVMTTDSEVGRETEKPILPVSSTDEFEGWSNSCICFSLYFHGCIYFASLDSELLDKSSYFLSNFFCIWIVYRNVQSIFAFSKYADNSRL